MSVWYWFVFYLKDHNPNNTTTFLKAFFLILQIIKLLLFHHILKELKHKHTELHIDKDAAAQQKIYVKIYISLKTQCACLFIIICSIRLVLYILIISHTLGV